MTGFHSRWAQRAVAALCAIACALASWTCMPTYSWGAPGTYTVVVQGTSGEHTIEAYQVFGGSVSTDSTLTFRLSRPVWGAGVTAAGQEALGDAAARFSLIDDNPALARELANELVDGGWLDPASAVRGVYNNDTGGYVLHHLEAGCYLIKDAAGTDADQDGFAYIPYLMVIAGNVDANARANAPSLVKKIYGPQASVGRPDVAAAPNDALSVELTATLPINLDDYESYGVAFSDRIPADSAVDLSSVEVTVGGRSLEPSDYTASLESDGSLAVALDDLKLLGASPQEQVRVDYALTCGDTEGTYEIDASLVYSNDPNPGGETSLGTTAPVASTLTVQVPVVPEPTITVGGVPAVPHGLLVAVLGACVLAVAAVVGVVTRKHEV